MTQNWNELWGSLRVLTEAMPILFASNVSSADISLACPGGTIHVDMHLHLDLW